MILDAAVDLEDLCIPPGNRLEALRGDRKGPHSIRINDHWRIRFTWTDTGPEDVAVDIGVPPRRINEIVHGKRRISADTALRLSRYLGTTDLFWINLQTRYDLEAERDAPHPAAPVGLIPTSPYGSVAGDAPDEEARHRRPPPRRRQLLTGR